MIIEKVANSMITWIHHSLRYILTHLKTFGIHWAFHISHKNTFTGLYGKPEIVSSPLVFPNQQQQQDEDFRPPSRPGDPGYVQYTAQHWGESDTKTPRHSPTEV